MLGNNPKKYQDSSQEKWGKIKMSKTEKMSYREISEKKMFVRKNDFYKEKKTRIS